MNDFDRVVYWKDRMSKRVDSAFWYVSELLKEVKNDMAHIGVNVRNAEEGFKQIGDGFDELKSMISSIGKTIGKGKENV